jgi:poly-gamma-glutamate synthesis protein (capsule biosynthesis protein)
VVCLALVLAHLLSVPSDLSAAPQVKLIFGGDVMLGRGVSQSLDERWGEAFSAVEPRLSDADVAFANLESPLTTESMLADGYDLRANPKAVEALTAAGFDVMSVANNHAWDAGRAGLLETITVLCGSGIMPGGEAGELVAEVPACQDLQADVVELLAFDDSGVSLDIDAAVSRVAAAAEGFRPVVVSIHWGGEYQATPSPRQRTVAAALSAAGATIVIGHGPHVLQPIEWVGDTLVAYSLGNLLFDQPYPIDCRWGALLEVVVRGKNIVAVKVIPTVGEDGRIRPSGDDWKQMILDRLMPESS